MLRWRKVGWWSRLVDSHRCDYWPCRIRAKWRVTALEYARAMEPEQVFNPMEWPLSIYRCDGHKDKM